MPETRPDTTQTDANINRVPNWEDIAIAICCGKHCDANNHGPDNEMSPDRYCKTHGCESDDIYKSANAVVDLLKRRAANGHG